MLPITHDQTGSADSQVETIANMPSNARLAGNQRDGRHSSRQCKDAFDEFMEFLLLRLLVAQAPAPQLIVFGIQ